MLRSVECLRSYTGGLLLQDSIAGVTVGLVALPLAMAFAIATGVSPQAEASPQRERLRARRPIFSLGGAKTPVAGMVHALTLLVILLAAAPLARFVPLATLAAVLFVVAYNMGEWREIATILRLSKTDIAVWLTTFALTVVADLTVAVGVGMALAALLYIYRVAETTTVEAVTPEYLDDGQAHILQDKEIPANVTILRIHGPFLFGASEKLADATRDLGHFEDVVILRLRNMTALDATGLHALERFSERLHKAGKTLLMCGARDQPLQSMSRSDFLTHVGGENVLPNIEQALVRARQIQDGFSGIGRELALQLEQRPL